MQQINEHLIAVKIELPKLTVQISEVLPEKVDLVAILHSPESWLETQKLQIEQCALLSKQLSELTVSLTELTQQHELKEQQK